ENGSEETAEVYRLSEVAPEDDYFAANLQLLQALAPMPHIDAVEEISKRKDTPMTELDLKHLNRRLESVKYWLENYASDEEKMQLHDTLPDSVSELDIIQRAFLNRLGHALVDADWEAEALQVKIFDVTRTTPIKQPLAFQAMYTALFDRRAGPRAGNLFVFLERDYLVKHFQAISYNKVEFWQAANLSKGEFEAWLQEHQENIESASVEKDYADDIGALELCIAVKDGKIHARRMLFEMDEATFNKEADVCLQQWVDKFNLKM
ncbi:MAG: lysine--tRNA ligase, partial [Pseudomonadota bacterium]